MSTQLQSNDPAVAALIERVGNLIDDVHGLQEAVSSLSKLIQDRLVADQDLRYQVKDHEDRISSLESQIKDRVSLHWLNVVWKLAVGVLAFAGAIETLLASLHILGA